MTSAQARKLIGKNVTWNDTYCPKNGYIMRSGKILDVKGKNICVDQFGTVDWKWLTEMNNLKEYDV